MPVPKRSLFCGHIFCQPFKISFWRKSPWVINFFFRSIVSKKFLAGNFIKAPNNSIECIFGPAYWYFYLVQFSFPRPLEQRLAFDFIRRIRRQRQRNFALKNFKKSHQGPSLILVSVVEHFSASLKYHMCLFQSQTIFPLHIPLSNFRYFSFCGRRFPQG